MTAVNNPPEWTHPRIANPDALRSHWPEIAHEANQALWRRKDAYPARVTAGKMSAEDAAQEIATWQEIANDWDWICTGLGTPASKDSLPERINALDTAIERFFQVVDGQGGTMTPEMALQGAALATMRWFAERERAHDYTKQVRWLAGFGHDWRARNLKNATEERKAA